VYNTLNGDMLRGRLTDISAEGARLVGELGLRPACCVHLLFQPPGQSGATRTLARVVRMVRDQDGGLFVMGLRFVQE